MSLTLCPSLSTAEIYSSLSYRSAVISTATSDTENNMPSNTKL
jgi:hypothetical protein